MPESLARVALTCCSTLLDPVALRTELPLAVVDATADVGTLYTGRTGGVAFAASEGEAGAVVRTVLVAAPEPETVPPVCGV